MFDSTPTPIFYFIPSTVGVWPTTHPPSALAITRVQSIGPVLLFEWESPADLKLSGCVLVRPGPSIVSLPHRQTPPIADRVVAPSESSKMYALARRR
ncbi:hypothetical protein CTheo_5648 [Ceratobasidium theobromae]|uniref:Uncharacterized protein n=1 Tax=Ceratobasidium theobromae TaxID=1582974 RepID=A0A5N5QHF8_9AGAM|nr:hypothetical protein CTheo_5648 [Ceratobasidium theobromae]